MVRLGRFDKWGYKNSFSKGELARELVYMHRDCDTLKNENQKYKEAIDKAVYIAWRYGQTDGDHHQKWVTDQMVRALLGSDYESFVKDYEEDDYEWDIGIAP